MSARQSAEPAEPISKGDIYASGEYRMAVTDVRDGTVIWDGLYDRDYKTAIERFRAFLLCPIDRWVKVAKGR